MLPSLPYIATVDQYASLRMDHVNFIGKIGFAADFKPFLFGLTITLPSPKIFGTGTMTKSLEGHNLNFHIPLIRFLLSFNIHLSWFPINKKT